MINRTLSPILKNKTPFKILHSSQPTYSNIKLFVCFAYACTIDHGRSKFDPRGKQYVYLGSSDTTEGHILLDFYTQDLFISRYVIFVEYINSNKLLFLLLLLSLLVRLLLFLHLQILLLIRTLIIQCLVLIQHT